MLELISMLKQKLILIGTFELLAFDYLVIRVENNL